MRNLRACILVLARAGEGDRKHLTVRAIFHQQHRRILHGQLAAQVGIDPFHRCIFEGLGALGDQVEDIVRPVLDSRVAAAPAFLHDDFNNRAVQAVGAVGRRCAALDIMHPCAFINDDERALELPHVLRVNAEVGLQGISTCTPGGT